MLNADQKTLKLTLTLLESVQRKNLEQRGRNGQVIIRNEWVGDEYFLTFTVYNVDLMEWALVRQKMVTQMLQRHKVSGSVRIMDKTKPK